MKPSSALPGTAPLRNSGFKLWLGGLVAVALLLGFALASFYPRHKNLPDPKKALTAPHRPSANARKAKADAPPSIDLYRFALNALLVPLLDDTEPPEWTDTVIELTCAPGTKVMVDGEPLMPGKPIPATAFTVVWNMDLCAPLGNAVELSGSVELTVFHEDTGLSAIVVPERLQVESHRGRTWLHGPFAAETSLAKPVTMP